MLPTPSIATFASELSVPSHSRMVLTLTAIGGLLRFVRTPDKQVAQLGVPTEEPTSAFRCVGGYSAAGANENGAVRVTHLDFGEGYGIGHVRPSFPGTESAYSREYIRVQ